jgi:hypothetical protein
MTRKLYAALFAVLVLTTTGLAKFAGPATFPIERLIANTNAYISEHPNDAMGPYTLARIHYLALATRAAQLGAFEQQGRPPSVDEQFRHVVPPSRGGAPADVSEDQLRGHLTASVENYQKAIRMDGSNGLFHLGLASVSEAALTSGIKLTAIPGSSPSAPPQGGDFAPLWREQAIAEYLRAYELSVQADTAIRSQPIQGLNSLVSYEAGQRYVAMVNARGPRDREPQTLTAVQATLKTLDNKPRGAVTPIVFSLSNAAPLEDLLDEQRTVTFNLDGTGRPQRYTWLRPDTGVLVWDPAMTGAITSGHQLFGSVSFNMFWSDGYRALDALDDNRDGLLMNDELRGLAVWFDRNQDGVSQPGEVLPIDRTGIAALSVRATGRIGASLSNAEGLITNDGRVLPTYDWTTEPIRPAS